VRIKLFDWRQALKKQINPLYSEDNLLKLKNDDQFINIVHFICYTARTFYLRSKLISMKRNNNFFWLASIASLSFALLGTEIVNNFINERIPVFGSFIGLQPSLNQGIAFGMHLGFLQPILISVALIFVIWIALRNETSMLEQIGFGLITGGGVANVLDRIQDGYVTDIFQIGRFPIFNVADSFITIGVVFLLINMIKRQNF
jgi:signal peptidase II